MTATDDHDIALDEVDRAIVLFVQPTARPVPKEGTST
jgi:hypothetical protein